MYLERKNIMLLSGNNVFDVMKYSVTLKLILLSLKLTSSMNEELMNNVQLDSDE